MVAEGRVTLQENFDIRKKKEARGNERTESMRIRVRGGMLK